MVRLLGFCGGAHHICPHSSLGVAIHTRNGREQLLTLTFWTRFPEDGKSLINALGPGMVNGWDHIQYSVLRVIGQHTRCAYHHKRMRVKF